jgi:hypothetical protein
VATEVEVAVDIIPATGTGTGTDHLLPVQPYFHNYF